MSNRARHWVRLVWKKCTVFNAQSFVRSAVILLKNQFKVHGFYQSAATTKHLIQNMKFLIFSLVIFLNLLSNIRSILQCFVKENISNEQKNCIFPFTLDTDPDFAYNECTKIHDPFGKHWCSTKVSAWLLKF